MKWYVVTINLTLLSFLIVTLGVGPWGKKGEVKGRVGQGKEKWSGKICLCSRVERK